MQSKRQGRVTQVVQYLQKNCCKCLYVTVRRMHASGTVRDRDRAKHHAPRNKRSKQMEGASSKQHKSARRFQEAHDAIALLTAGSVTYCVTVTVTQLNCC